MDKVTVYIGDKLARYSFGSDHPFGPDRHDAFWNAACEMGLDKHVVIHDPVDADLNDVLCFHTRQYVTRVQTLSAKGSGFLDRGDTPAVKGIFEAAMSVVGSTLDAAALLMQGRTRRVFIPIAGLHHARRDSAAGFCVFNDCGVVIEVLRQHYGVKKIAYVDIDAHHGDGVFYAFEHDADLYFADIHEDGQYLYPGTGAASETGKAVAVGTKLNLPVDADADDQSFMLAWAKIENFLHNVKPDFILFQCGADSIAGDPITHLRFTTAAHQIATHSLCAISDQYCAGRLLVMGGGGYNRLNIARAWTTVLQALIQSCE